MIKLKVSLVAALTAASFVIAEAAPVVVNHSPVSFSQIKPPPPPPDPLHLFSKKRSTPARPKRRKITLPKVKLPPHPAAPRGAPPRPF